MGPFVLTHLTGIHSNLLCGKPCAEPWEHSRKHETHAVVLGELTLYSCDMLRKK